MHLPPNWNRIFHSVQTCKTACEITDNAAHAQFPRSPNLPYPAPLVRGGSARDHMHSHFARDLFCAVATPDLLADGLGNVIQLLPTLSALHQLIADQSYLSNVQTSHGGHDTELTEASTWSRSKSAMGKRPCSVASKHMTFYKQGRVVADWMSAWSRGIWACSQWLSRENKYVCC